MSLASASEQMLQPPPSSAMLLTITKFLSMKTAFRGRKLSQIILFWMWSSNSGGQCYGCQQLPAAACDAGVWTFSGTAPHHLPGPWGAPPPFTKDVPQNEDNSGRQPQDHLESSLHLLFLAIHLASDLLLPQAGGYQPKIWLSAQVQEFLIHPHSLDFSP